MFGFVNYDRHDRRVLGGEVVQRKKRNMRLTFLALGVVAFVVLNLILHALTSF